jgi:cytochrome c-type biogenesis protein CcmE
LKPSKLILGILLIVASGALGLSAFNKSLTPYVDFREAKAASGSVQVSGVVLKPQVAYDARNGTLTFPLKDHTGEVMPVVFRGGKPNNFDQAEQVVAIGKCENGTFVAESLLTKCPSKYEAEPGKKKTASADGVLPASG